MPRGSYSGPRKGKRDLDLIPGEQIPDEELAPLEEDPLPEWAQGLRARMDIKKPHPDLDDVKVQHQRTSNGEEDITRLTIPVPTQMLELIRLAADRHQPSLMVGTYLRHCITLGLVGDLKVDYWITRTQMEPDDPAGRPEDTAEEA